MTETVIHTGSAHLCLRIREDSSVPIVLVSGGPGMPDYLQPVAQMLVGYKTITYDQRGTGASVAMDGDYSVDAHVADLESICNTLEVERMHLFGHSWGGLLAQLYATAYPSRVASLFLSSPSTGVGRDWVAMEREVMQYNRRRSTHWQFLLLGLWSLLARLPGALGRCFLQRMYSQVLSNYQLAKPTLPTDPKVLAGVGPSTTFKTRASIGRLPEDCLDKVLPHANIPMYVSYGQYDIYGSHIEAVRKRYPGATFEILEGCGHLPWMDREDLFRSKLVSFYELLDRP